MRIKFKTGYRAALIGLVMIWAWSLWAAAQSSTNEPPRAGARSSALVSKVQRWSENPVTFGLDQVAILDQHTLFGHPLWKYLASLIYVLLAFYVAKLLDWSTRAWLKTFVRRSRSKLGELVLQFLRGPVKVVVFVVLLHLGLNLFDWPAVANYYFSKGLILLVAASLTYMAVKVVTLMLDVWRQRAAPETDAKFHAQLFSFLQTAATIFVVIVAMLVTAQNMGVNITAAITSLSIGGLAVGLAAQDTLANLFGAIAVLVDKPFRVGDQIKVDSSEGEVEAVGLRSTRIRNPEGYLIAVPNKTMGNASISNLSRRTSIKTTMNLLLPRTLDGQKVRRALALLREIYRANPSTEDVWVSLNQFAGANLNILIVHWWKGTDYQKYLAGMEELNLAAKERLEAEGINLA